MILLSPVKTEKSIGKVEFENSIVFEVSTDSTKDTIKKEVEKLFEVKVDSVKTYITPKGRKRAIVKMAEGYKAEDITTKLKMA